MSQNGQNNVQNSRFNQDLNLYCTIINQKIN